MLTNVGKVTPRLADMMHYPSIADHTFFCGYKHSPDQKFILMLPLNQRCPKQHEWLYNLNGLFDLGYHAKVYKK